MSNISQTKKMSIPDAKKNVFFCECIVILKKNIDRQNIIKYNIGNVSGVNKMKKIFMFLFGLILACGLVVSLPFSKSENASAESFVSFYSTKNAPLFYGATEITIDKNVTSSFSEKDSRFRIFAKDFEDGDISDKIRCVENTVQSTVCGDYVLKYEVTDSHSNTSTIDVPVHVLDKEEGECKVVRTIYAIPAMKNLSLVGTERCNNGDRQILGIFLPENQSAQIKMIEGNKNLQITFFTNTKLKNSFATINCNSEEYQTITNNKGSEFPASVPLVTSPRLDEEKINEVFKIEVKYDKNVKALDYYHYKDDEQEFKNNWKKSENEFGVVDGEAIMCVVPFQDVDKLSGYVASGYGNPFESIDSFLGYYKEVVDRMDKMIGLEFDATSALDQNYRIKYTAVADSSSSAGAYYAGNYIAVCQSTIAPIFQYGWGTLHEIAHGYQGSLGKGMFLNETGNNVLAHYIQMDTSLYKKSDRYIGALESCEEKWNNSRYSQIKDGKTIFNNDDGTYTNTHEKLYCIVNMLDAFEGSQTYAKLFKFYRKLVSEGKSDGLQVCDVYAKFFAEEYSVNIIPYLKAWTMPVSESVEAEILELGLPSMFLLKDTVSDEMLGNVISGENLKIKYGLVSDETLKNYQVEGSLKLELEIDNFNLVKGKNVALFKGDEVVCIKKIEAKEVDFGTLPVGSFEIKLPVIYEFEQKLCSAYVCEGENSVKFVFESSVVDNSKHPVNLTIFGIYGTVGFSMSFDEDFANATMTYGQANIGNMGFDEESVFVSVKVEDSGGNGKFNVEVKGKQYFFQVESDKTLEFSENDKITIQTQRPDLVKVVSKQTGNRVDAYNFSGSNTIELIVTSKGLKLASNDEFDPESVLYEHDKTKFIDIIENYQEKAKEQELQNKRVNASEKIDVLNAFEALNETDKSIFVNFVNKIKKGGAPTIVQNQESVKISTGDTLDLYSLISIFDNEDFEIESNSKNVEIHTNFVNHVAGTYDVTFVACDSDGNKTTKTISVEVSKIAEENEKQNKLSHKQVVVAVSLISGGLVVLFLIAIVSLKVLKKKER